MENEKWGFNLKTDNEQVESKNYFLIIRFTLFFIVLLIIKPRFIMSKKDDFHVCVIDIVKLCLITGLLSLCSEFAPNLQKKLDVFLNKYELHEDLN